MDRDIETHHLFSTHFTGFAFSMLMVFFYVVDYQLPEQRIWRPLFFASAVVAGLAFLANLLTRRFSRRGSGRTASTIPTEPRE